ncbi:MAG TPA: hypothetical protein VKV80_06295 [Streptosporangiaceae bacterium]|nr:hypothetical protein [Streptosporangiaceae bacterium]
MGTRIMGDSVVLSSIPLTVNIAAAYINGRYAVSQAELEARFPHDRYGHCWIDVDGSRANAADMLDVENFDATPATANLWVQSWHILRRASIPVIYCNRGNEQAVITACASGGSVLGKHYGLCVATLDGTQVTGNGIVACQWKGAAQTRGNWDETLVYDGSLWPPAAPKPVIASPPAGPPPSKAAALSALETISEYIEAA